MKLLLDESLPRRLISELGGHDVATVQQMSWTGKKNGELLQLLTSLKVMVASTGLRSLIITPGILQLFMRRPVANRKFDAFLTADQNLQYQQNLSQTTIPVIILAAKSNRFHDLKPMIPEVLKALNNMQKGSSHRMVLLTTRFP